MPVKKKDVVAINNKDRINCNFILFVLDSLKYFFGPKKIINAREWNIKRAHITWLVVRSKTNFFAIASMIRAKSEYANINTIADWIFSG